MAASNDWINSRMKAIRKLEGNIKSVQDLEGINWVEIGALIVDSLSFAVTYLLNEKYKETVKEIVMPGVVAGTTIDRMKVLENYLKQAKEKVKEAGGVSDKDIDGFDKVIDKAIADSQSVPQEFVSIGTALVAIIAIVFFKEKKIKIPIEFGLILFKVLFCVWKHWRAQTILKKMTEQLQQVLYILKENVNRDAEDAGIDIPYPEVK